MHSKSKSLNAKVQLEKNFSLSPEFAGKLLDLEMLLEESADFETVAQVLAMYKIAIEMFANERDSRSYILQKRRQALLQKPEVQSALKWSSSPLCFTNLENQRPQENTTFEESRAHLTSHNYEDSPARNTVSQHHVETNKACQKATFQLKQQFNGLSERLQLRTALKAEGFQSARERRTKSTLLG